MNNGENAFWAELVGFVELVVLAVASSIGGGYEKSIPSMKWRSGTKFYSHNYSRSLVVTMGFCCMDSTWSLACNSHNFAWDSREAFA
jgi:hypothetical protein